MTPEREQKILSNLYDRLLDAITYSPEGKSPPFSQGIHFQMAKNQVLNPADFANMLSPLNPRGDMRAAEAFSAMVDAVPTPGVLWGDSGNKVSEIFKLIAEGANTDSEPSEKQASIYRKAYAFLNTETEVKGFDDVVKKKTNPSPTAIAYEDARAAYISAVCGYRSAYNGYNLDKVEDQRGWNAVAPGLQLNIDRAWNEWSRAGKAEVEQAQNALLSTINDAGRNAIAEARRMTGPSYRLPSTMQSGNPWLPSYAIASNWADASAQASKLTFKSTYLNEKESTSAHQYAAEASGRWGLWHASGGVSGKSENRSAHMDAENLSVEAELMAVSIQRPWFNPMLLGMNGWWMNGIEKGGISNGSSAGTGRMARVPTGFVVARNVKITADFSSNDKEFCSKSIATKASGGWGPFSVSGSYAHSSSKSEFSAKFDGSTLQLPGLQVVAWISAIMPVCPPMAAK